MINVSIDFETYSECDLKKCGAWVYSEHHSTEVLCMAYAYGDDAPKLWLPGDEFPEFMSDDQRKRTFTDGIYVLHGWNSQFEYAIMQNTLGIYPPPIHCWSDTMARAAAQALPRSLGACAEAMGLTGDKAKDKRGKRLIQLLSKPQKSTKKMLEKGEPATYRRLDQDLLIEMYNYCKQDVVTEREISKRLMQLSKVEREVWEMDQEINIRGVQVDLENVENSISIYWKEWDNLLSQLKEMTGLKNPNSHQQFLPWLQSIGYTRDNTQAETLEEFLEEIKK